MNEDKLNDIIDEDMYQDSQLRCNTKLNEVSEILIFIVDNLKSKSFIKDDLESYVLKIKDVYKIHDRFLYSHITELCFGLNKEEQDNVISNLNYIYENENNDSNSDIIIKFYDHFNLAIKQLSKLENQSNNFETLLEVETEKVKEIAEDTKNEVKETRKSLMSELISLIAMFTAVAFVVFGGISSFSGITDTLETVINSQKGYDIFYESIVIWGICMFNILYLFFYFIWTIINGRSFEVDGKNNLLKKISRNSLFFIVNIILILILIFV